MAPAGEWQVVRRRRRFPDGWRTPADDEIDRVRPYSPYSSKPTYAQVTAATSHGSGSSSRTNSSNNSPTASQLSSKPTSPQTTKPPHFFYSPHSPTLLRFPPQSTYPEWRGRCFRCCRTGHAQAKCRNPHKCGKSWKDGHISTQCNQSVLNPAALPFHPPRHTYKPVKAEPAFEELLIGNAKPSRPEMPDGRPKKLTVFIERDDDFFTEVDNLSRAVVMYAQNQALFIEVHQVVKMAVDTKLVREEEIRVAQLTRERFLIHLPRGLAVETFVKALPADLWEQGFAFQQWSLLDDASVKMPRFKVLLDLVGLPLHQWRDVNVSKTIAQLGVYLGSVQQEHASDFTAFRVAIGTDDLMRIPEELEVVVGGLTYLVQVVPVHWEKGPIYGTTDFPILPQRFAKPPPPTEAADDDLDHAEVEAILNSGSKQGDNPMISCSRKVLMELCQGRPLSSIPPELRQFVYGTQSVGEISIQTLEDLVFAIADPVDAPNSQNNGCDEERGGTTQLPNSFSHSQSGPHPTTANMVLSHSTPEGTKGGSVLGSGSLPAQGAIISGSEKGKEKAAACNDRESSDMGPIRVDGAEAGRVPPQVQSNRIMPHHHRSQGILKKHRTFASNRVGTKPTPVASFSRGNRARGMMGRGRGRTAINYGPRHVAGHGIHITDTHTQRRPLGVPQKIKKNGGAAKERNNKEQQEGATDVHVGLPRSFQWRREDHLDPNLTSCESSDVNFDMGQPSQAHTDLAGLTILKRKPSSSEGRVNTSAKPKQQRTGLSQPASVDLNPENFFRVHVDKEHCTRIGEACGFKTEDVLQVLAEDNEERELLEKVNLDPASEDDLDTDEEES